MIEILNLGETLADLSQRLDDNDRYSVAGKLTRGILGKLNVRSPMNITADEFNQAAEEYYRNDLRKTHLVEAFRILREDFLGFEAFLYEDGCGEYQEAVRCVLGNGEPLKFLDAIKRDVVEEGASEDDLKKLIQLMLILIGYETGQYQGAV